MEINIEALSVKLAEKWLEDVSTSNWYIRIGNNKYYNLKSRYQVKYDNQVEEYRRIISKFVIDGESTEKDNTEQTVYSRKIE